MVAEIINEHILHSISLVFVQCVYSTVAAAAAYATACFSLVARSKYSIQTAAMP
jgi:hypothetical protein